MFSELSSSLTRQGVKLVAVSKTKPISEIERVYDLGQRIFGENRVQELVEKYKALPKDIQWHLIGSLQRKNVKFIAPFVDMIHSVDSIALAKKINSEARKNDRTIKVLLQIKIASEESKHGWDEKELVDELKSNPFSELRNIEICGLMGMATFTTDKKQLKKEFTLLNQLFLSLKAKYFRSSRFLIKSMGMSGDYKTAIACGSNMVRIGSLIFGHRG